MCILYTRNPLVTTCIDKVKWITAHNCGKPKWHSFTPKLSWKGKIWGLDIVSQNAPYKTNYWSKIADLLFSQEKLPYTLIPVIASTHRGKYAVPLFFLGGGGVGNPVYNFHQFALHLRTSSLIGYWIWEHNYDPMEACFFKAWLAPFLQDGSLKLLNILGVKKKSIWHFWSLITFYIMIW